MTDLVKDVILKANAAPPPPWSIRLADKTKRQYDWHAQYFMADGSVRQQGVPKPVTTTELTLIPEIPSA
jgi:hypothetical protein